MGKCINCGSDRIVYEYEDDAYRCLDCGYEYPKQYFFISHSHLDIEKVRIIRNIIEDTFFYEPILFFLKCLSDENEITNLIKREINERIWFIYCESENSRKSKYVQEERQYIDELIASGKKINKLTIDLDRFNIWDKECIEDIRRQVETRIAKTKLYMTNSYADRVLARSLTDEFKKRGYTVFTDIDVLRPSDNWASVIGRTIEQCSCKDGVNAILITANSYSSRAFKHDVTRVIESNRGGAILPIVLTDDLPNGLLLEDSELDRILRQYHFVMTTRDNVIDDVIDWLENN